MNALCRASFLGVTPGRRRVDARPPKVLPVRSPGSRRASKTMTRPTATARVSSRPAVTNPSRRPAGKEPPAPPAEAPETPARAPATVAAPAFQIGDKAVHPAHGLGEVMAIETRDFGGTPALYYVLRILDNGMKVMVPTNAAAQVGLRSVMSAREADAVLTTMRAREVAVDLQPWSRRFRAYTEMLKSGSPHEVAKVLRDMHRLRFDKDLSFGERRLLDQAKSLLVKELALAKQVTEAQLLAQVAQIFKS
jgi:CarD family transcriptional regulator